MGTAPGGIPKFGPVHHAQKVHAVTLCTQKKGPAGRPPPPTPSAAHTRSAATGSVAPLGGQAGHIPHGRAGEQVLAPSLQFTSV
mmetsp:Transcript_121316/g.210887  ORF Transcript_121316/g.210887 Transcript_121316/m.210887 type:complete len:84 (-) Transcript_121316:81-332(-)